jgi:hypothetical protein
MRHAVWSLAIASLLITSGCARAPQEKERLLEVYTPTFERLPPRESAAQSIRTLAKDWREGSGKAFVNDVMSAQGLAVGVALTVILLVAWDFRRVASTRNVDMLLLFAAGLLFFDVMRFFAVIRLPSYLNLLDWVFIAVFTISLVLLVRAARRVTREPAQAWVPNLPLRALAVLAIALLAADIGVALSRRPDDAGWFVNLGAQRLRERGRLPYGDPLLTATPAAAYGPLLYLAHVPFQVALSPEPVNPISPPRPNLTKTPYYLPPTRATQLCTVAFHVAGVAGLFMAARQLAGAHVAWALVCLYCGSLAVLGIGGREDQVAGITFVSHIAPASMTLLALAAVRSPALSGTLLALATGVGFYPAFMAPAWLGFYWDDAARRTRFILGFGIAAAVIAFGVYAMSRPAGERSRLGTIMYDTLGHHTDPAGYGSSVFGFWGQREGIRRLLNTPLVGSSGLTSPAWLAFAAFLAVTFFLARGRRPADLALLAGAVAIGATLVKPHATGTYLAWSYPLLLIGFLTRGYHERDKGQGTRQKVPFTSDAQTV